MDFFQSYADPDVWMHAPPTTDPLVPYDYVVIDINDLFASMTDPKQFFNTLQCPPWNYKLKDVGTPHRSANFFHNADGTLYMGTQTNAKHLLAFWSNPSPSPPPPPPPL